MKVLLIVLVSVLAVSSWQGLTKSPKEVFSHHKVLLISPKTKDGLVSSAQYAYKNLGSHIEGAQIRKIVVSGDDNLVREIGSFQPTVVLVLGQSAKDFVIYKEVYRDHALTHLNSNTDMIEYNLRFNAFNSVSVERLEASSYLTPVMETVLSHTNSGISVGAVDLPLIDQHMNGEPTRLGEKDLGQALEVIIRSMMMEQDIQSTRSKS